MTSAANGVTELVAPSSVVCLPGEPVLFLANNAVVAIGRGIARLGTRTIDGVSGEVLVATVCGPLTRRKGNFPGAPWSYSIEAAGGRYLPCVGDAVVGTVVRVLPLSYQISLGGAHPATLDALAFDGATKASRPRLKMGDHVYCHVVTAAKDADVDVSCCAVGDMEAKEWTTGESVFGPLHHGCVVRVGLSYARKLQSSDSSNIVLSLLGERVPFEIAVGANGRVWVRGAPSGADASLEQTRTIAVAACVAESQHDVTSLDVRARVESYFPAVGGAHHRVGGAGATESGTKNALSSADNEE
ncbi:ribosomal RNA processing protein 40, putative [Bodo saltans]|uniref:Ribosomal RNA processing protein 40, putative n=1 Tax=Bodo saltans TaxID=75058 RepID=A0A0S4IMH2_BODSA|nr:ribosomal RNA processing protein 40, putative [Bodo saltans]|eukprot:CUE73776.1 ribosomal RNA processing protein 40, putative [Bodo saltans]